MQDIFVTKIGMMQAWNTAGKRIAVTRCRALANLVVSAKELPDKPGTFALTLGCGKKTLRNMKKPLRVQLAKSGFSVGAQFLRETNFLTNETTVAPTAGSSISAIDVLAVGDVVKVQGTSKGKGFTGAVKRYGFHGGPKTHGQSDRTRAVGSIGAGTTPGRVYKGKRMPGHAGVETVTIAGLVIVYVNPEEQEIWLSGPVPGAIRSQLRIRKQNVQKEVLLDFAASGISEPVVLQQPEPVTEPAEPAEATETTEVTA
ncbi:MAG: 50S ribosomal protein L3 [Candidatus Pacebacteria bacterium RIFCSPHIGHO2_01_FULL_46_16]|nr:MAG: 50S ribosomal protein L3 [Candidatus Pacebacteria bacterium RIFCSPHIGHO2_01_FULL_46_16]OGJ22029.1 MAG: 50S ribosomal protein L3 [Candidatus Pacebacteria bacterium RIFCSPHIGHO2_02_FULL_46_9]OGJ38236.1 MAG: 50S ribosomal protein L3 [Candidatus Pacebacteria bacterium RIFCSPLOWO2_01_FULL_47_12]